ncbi:S8 family serine peptidase [Paraneptunicella aestuarii]|uniref:S8 family serine peptidase n=1 Tax=Paraneptunicella aestuarii TaxID=2831148 RepID=UPI001E2A8BA8|nr:S8 family serine peptidase [Paraneptunicella aestuarii]UAA37835.1 S8 family serine peptidase [Paraneptunicella aestuarii]
MKNTKIAFTLSSIAALLASSTTFAAQDFLNSHLSSEQKVVAQEKIKRNGQEYTQAKIIGRDGSVTLMNFDENGRQVASVPDYVRPLVGAGLQKVLSQYSASSQAGMAEQDQGISVDVRIVLREDIETGTPTASGELEVLNGKASLSTRNGLEVHPDSLSVMNLNEQVDLSARFEQRAAKNRAQKQRFLELAGWDVKQMASLEVNASASSIQRSVQMNELPSFLNKMENLAKKHPELIAGVELVEAEESELDGAHAEMKLTQYAFPYATRQGDGIGIYMREANGTACPDTQYLNTSLYTEIGSHGTSGHGNRVGVILQKGSPKAHLYCGSNHSVNFSSYNPAIYITNHSWGSGSSTTYGSLDRDFDNFAYNDKVLNFKSAGNRGTSDGNVTSPGKAFNVMTVGNYDDATDTMSASSSFTDPDTNAEKPEIVAPGTSIDTGAAGSGSGTSYASPNAAAFAADLLGAYDYFKNHPQALKSVMLASSRKNIEGATSLSEKDGVGAVDFYDAYYSWNSEWWEGANGAHFDANNEIIKTRYLSAGVPVRAVISWLVPGQYAYDNKKPNMDLDLKVYDPNGNLITGSYSVNNAFEVVEFTPATSGDYDFKIHRFSNSGEGDLRLAIGINW